MMTKKKVVAVVDGALQEQRKKNEAVIATIRSENKRALSEQKDQLKADYVKRLDLAIDKVVIEERAFLGSGKGEIEDTFSPISEDYIYADVCVEAESRKYEAAIKAISEASGETADVFESVEKTVAQVTYGRNKGWEDIGGGSSIDPERMLSGGKRQALQTACVKASLKDPHGKSITKNIRRFTIGRGIKFTCPVEAVQNVLDDFWKKNKMEKRQKDMVEDRFVEGEYFMLFFKTLNSGMNGGTTRLRKIRTAEIAEIETNSEDVETILAYKREFTKGGRQEVRWYPDVGYFDLPDEPENKSVHETEFVGTTDGDVVMYFVKDGPADELRGRPTMESILPWLKHFETVCIDSVRRWHEQCKVIWFKKITGRGVESTTRERRSPKGSIMLPETANVSYRSEAPDIKAGDAETLMTQVLYTIGSGVTIPLFMLHQDPSNANYASIRKSDTPFSQMIVDMQDDWSIVFDRAFRIVIDAAIVGHKLSEKVELMTYTQEAQWQAMDLLISGVLDGDSVESLTEAIRPVLEEGVEKQQIAAIDVPIEITFPDVVRESELDQAKTLEVWDKLGVSPQTIYSRMGLNWKQELVHQATIRKMKLEGELEDDEKRLAKYEKGQGTASPEESTLHG